jgi:YihY family inner membrane protein
MASSASPVQVKVHHDTPPSRFAAVAAAATAVGASVGALVARRAAKRPAQHTDGEANKVLGDVKESAAGGATKKPNKIVQRIDAYQQAHPFVGFPFAVAKKFGDDAAGNLAALIAYYGFLSLFPLLLALTTVLATLLAGQPQLQDRILDSALAQFPVIGDQIRENVNSLDRSGVALAVGIVGALWGGMGVMKAAGNAMDDLWEVPKRARPTLVRALIRAALLLTVLGGGVVATTALSGLGTAGTSSFLPLKIIGLAVAAVVNVGVFVLGFRVLTVRDVALRDLVPGAVVAGLGWLALQSIGGYYVTHQLQGASQTYGMFAVVIGLLSWLYLQAQLTLFAAEINVVRAGHLWPRAIGPELTEADKLAYASYAEVEERRPDADVRVGFRAPTGRGRAGAATR